MISTKVLTLVSAPVHIDRAGLIDRFWTSVMLRNDTQEYLRFQRGSHMRSTEFRAVCMFKGDVTACMPTPSRGVYDN